MTAVPTRRERQRSATRKEKDQAIHNRFIERLEKGLQKVKKSCDSGRAKKVGAACHPRPQREEPELSAFRVKKFSCIFLYS